MEMQPTQLVPFDKCIFETRLKTRHINCNHLINHPAVSFTKNQLIYFKEQGMIPKVYFDEIEKAFSDKNFNNLKDFRGNAYAGNLIDFGPSEYRVLKDRCRKLGMPISNMLSIEHIAIQTIYKYKKERHIPSDLLERINRRLTMMENDQNKSEDTMTVKNDTCTTEIPKKDEPSDIVLDHVQNCCVSVNANDSNYKKVIQTLKTVAHCNGEASLDLNNLPERYDCNVETFVNSVFSLVSCENYVIFTTYNNGKPIFTLGEPM